MITKDQQPSESEKANFFFKLLKRSIKMVVKNIGHMFGLKNCIFFSCVMNGFGNMKEFDSRPVEICPCCLRKIFTNIVRKYSRLDDGKRVTENDILIFQIFYKTLIIICQISCHSRKLPFIMTHIVISNIVLIHQIIYLVLILTILFFNLVIFFQ